MNPVPHPVGRASINPEQIPASIPSPIHSPRTYALLDSVNITTSPKGALTHEAPNPPNAPERDPARHKRPPEQDRPLTQEEIDRIMSEVYRIILSAGAARKAEEEDQA